MTLSKSKKPLNSGVDTSCVLWTPLRKLNYLWVPWKKIRCFDQQVEVQRSVTKYPWSKSASLKLVDWWLGETEGFPINPLQKPGLQIQIQTTNLQTTNQGFPNQRAPDKIPWLPSTLPNPLQKKKRRPEASPGHGPEEGVAPELTRHLTEAGVPLVRLLAVKKTRPWPTLVQRKLCVFGHWLIFSLPNKARAPPPPPPRVAFFSTLCILAFCSVFFPPKQNSKDAWEWPQLRDVWGTENHPAVFTFAPLDFFCE